MRFAIRHAGGTAFAEARSWYECRAWAFTEYGRDVTVIACSEPPGAAPAIQVPPTLTAIELAAEHVESVRQRARSDMWRETLDDVASFVEEMTGKGWTPAQIVEAIRAKAAANP